MFEIEKRVIPEAWHKGDRERVYWIISRGISLVSLVGGFYFLVSPVAYILPYLSPFESTLDHLTATSIFSTLILTFALIAVYRDIGVIQQSQADEIAQQANLQQKVVEIQESQTNIMRRQEKIMAARFKPAVVIDNFKCEDETISFDLSNLGNGIARDIGLEIHIIPIKLPFDDLHLSDEIEAHPLGGMEVYPQPVSRVSNYSGNTLNRSLRVEKNVEFEIEAMMPNITQIEEEQKDAIGFIPFPSWWEKFSETEYDAVRLYMVVIFKDMIDDEYRIPSWILGIKDGEIDDFEDLINNTTLFTNPEVIEEDYEYAFNIQQSQMSHQSID